MRAVCRGKGTTQGRVVAIALTLCTALVGSSGSAAAQVAWPEVAKLTGTADCDGDEFGGAVAISGDTAIVGTRGDDDLGGWAGAAYILQRTGGEWRLAQKLTASDGAAGDQFGVAVAIYGDYAVVGARFAPVSAILTGAAYVFHRSAGTWTEQAKLTASDGAYNDRFGEAVAIGVDTVVAGAHLDDDAGDASGSAYVFLRSGTTWSQQAKLTASDAAAGDGFGRAVSLSLDTAVVGSVWDDNVGSAYVFVRSGTTWSQQAKLAASDAAGSDYFGASVGVSGDRALIGAYLDDDAGSGSGSAYVFERSGTSWSQTQKLTASDAAAGDRYGTSVSVDGDYAIVGAPWSSEIGLQSGKAYLYRRWGTGTWGQVEILSTSHYGDSYMGQSVAIDGGSAIAGAFFDDDAGSQAGSAYLIEGSLNDWATVAELHPTDTCGPSNCAAYDTFGSAAAVDGDYAVVGAGLKTANGFGNAGAAYVFARWGAGWRGVAKLTASDPNTNAQFGNKPFGSAISGNTILVGALGDSSAGNQSGAAYVFTGSRTTWTQQAKLTASGAAAADYFGISVALEGDTALVGASGDDDYGSNSGSVYVFQRSGTTWSQSQKLNAADAATNDYFAPSAISGDWALIGAWGDDDNGAESGSAYIFQRSGSTWSQQAKLTASDGAAGDNFGYSGAISGDWAIVGAWGDDDNGAKSGSAYVFQRSGSSWSQVQKLAPSDPNAGQQFGFGVAIQGDSALVSAVGDAGSTGAAYVFRRSGSTWSEVAKLVSSDGEAGDTLALGADLDGSTAVLGAKWKDDLGMTNAGAAYAYAIPWTGGDFSFDDGTAQGWTLQGPYHEGGIGPEFSNFTNGWSDQNDQRSAPGSDPTGDGNGSMQLYTPYHHGASVTATWWIMRLHSPDLSLSSVWQNAGGYRVKLAERMGGGTTPLYANLHVRVYDSVLAEDRWFFSGTAQSLSSSGDWDDMTFRWDTIPSFPTNYVVKEIHVNVWGLVADGPDLSGGVYLDEVVSWPFGDTDGDGILDDGDGTGTAGDYYCTGGQTVNCDDNCRYEPNADQADSGGIGGAGPDGIGTACQCGDVSNDGKVSLADFVQIRRWVASGQTVPPSPSFEPRKCDVTGDQSCSLADFVRVRQAVGGSPGVIVNQCEPAIP